MLNEIVRNLILEFFDQKIASIGLITAQNPQEIDHEEEYNECANNKLLADISSIGLEHFPTHYYGEEGFLIPGISKATLIDLGKKYNQNSVIWGQRVPEDRNGMTFSWKYLEDGKIRGEKISNHPFVCPNFDDLTV